MPLLEDLSLASCPRLGSAAFVNRFERTGALMGRGDADPWDGRPPQGAAGGVQLAAGAQAREAGGPAGEPGVADWLAAPGPRCDEYPADGVVLPQVSMAQ
jgi:hypothetical protein